MDHIKAAFIIGWDWLRTRLARNGRHRAPIVWRDELPALIPGQRFMLGVGLAAVMLGLGGCRLEIDSRPTPAPTTQPTSAYDGQAPRPATPGLPYERNN